MYRDRGTVYPVLRKDSLDLLRIDFGERYSVRYGNLYFLVRAWLILLRSTHTTAFFSPHGDSWRLLVEPYTKTFKLVGENGEIIKRLKHVQHDEDEVTSPSDSYDLSPSTFPVFGAFDDALRII